MIYFWGLLRDCTNFLLDYKNEAPRYNILKDEMSNDKDFKSDFKQYIGSSADKIFKDNNFKYIEDNKSLKNEILLSAYKVADKYQYAIDLLRIDS